MTKPAVVAYFVGTNNDWGGASRALLNFVRKLDRRLFTPLVVIPRPGPIQALLLERQIACEVWPIHERSRNLGSYALAIVKSMRFFRKHAIALIHMNCGAIGWKPAEILAALLLRIPVLNHLHTALGPNSSYLRYSAGIIGVSRYVCEHGDRRGVQCHVVHNVADFDRFSRGVVKRAALGLRPDSIVIGFFGQVRRIKGVELFLDLTRRLSDPRIEFVIAGELKGEDTYAPEEFAAMIGQDPRVKFLGYRDDVEDIYASCDIVVMPSQWEEPCAMVLFEASAAGKPIVATATGGTPEILSDGDTGYLVGKQDLDALVARVTALVQNADLRKAIGERAREYARQTFAEQPVRALEALYGKILAHA